MSIELIKKIAVHTTDYSPANALIHSLVSVCNQLNIEIQYFTFSNSISDFDPDLVVVTDSSIPKLTHYPTLGIVAEVYSSDTIIRSIMTYDAFVCHDMNVATWLNDLCFAFRKLDAPVMQIALSSEVSESSAETIAPPNDDSNAEKDIMATLQCCNDMMFARGYVEMEQSGPKIGTIMRAGGRDFEFLDRAIASWMAQTWTNKILIVVCWSNYEQIKSHVHENNIAAIVVDNRGGGRANSLWRGLRESLSAGCDLVGILDDDDVYHPNLMSQMMKQYQYVRSLSLHDPISRIVAGNITELQVTSAERFTPFEQRELGHFHFADRGSLSHKAFVYTTTSTLIVSKYLDHEVMQCPELEIGEDYFLSLLLVERGAAVFVPEVLSCAFDHGIDQSNYIEPSRYNIEQSQRLATRVMGRSFPVFENFDMGHSEHFEVEHSEYLRANVSKLKAIPNEVSHELSRTGNQWQYDGLAAGYYVIEVTMPSDIAEDAVCLALEKTSLLDFEYAENTNEPANRLFSAKYFHSKPGALTLTVPEGVMSPLQIGIRWISNAPIEHASSLKQYKRVWLYGTGALARNSLFMLAQEGIEIEGVADTFNRGNWQQLRIHSPDELVRAIRMGDVILIASMHWKAIVLELQKLSINVPMYHPHTLSSATIERVLD